MMLGTPQLYEYIKDHHILGGKWYTPQKLLVSS